MPVSRFDVVARADPQTLMRLLNYFAQLGMQPSHVNAVEGGQSMKIRIELPGMEEGQARVVAERMRSSVLVEAVSVRRGRRLLMPFSETTDDLSAE